MKKHEITKNYYANPQGIQLKDWFRATNPEAYFSFCIMNATKYLVRCGFKEGESIDKEVVKIQDYLQQAGEVIGADPEVLYKAIQDEIEMFMKYDGTNMDEISGFKLGEVDDKV